MSTVLVDSLDRLGGESEDESLLEFGHVDALLLEVGVLPLHTSWVELGSTSPVGVASSNS